MPVPMVLPNVTARPNPTLSALTKRPLGGRRECEMGRARAAIAMQERQESGHPAAAIADISRAAQPNKRR